MRLCFGWCILLSLAAASTALGQTPPLGSGEVPATTVEPDQPVRPVLPTLVERARQQPPAARAQQPPKPPFTLTPGQEAQLDDVLKQWEQRNKRIKTFDCEFTRWTYDPIFGTANKPKFEDTGVIKYAAPDRGMVRVDQTRSNGKYETIEDARAEHWISDGKSIFEFNHVKRQLIEHKLPKELQGEAIADSPLPFLFCADARKLKQRYFIRVITPADAQGQVWLEAFPRYQQDAANFQRAQFIMTAPGMSPYGLKLVEPNGKDSVSYQFFNIVVNDPLRPFKGDPFRAHTPFGWQRLVEESPAQQASQPVRVSRQ